MRKVVHIFFWVNIFWSLARSSSSRFVKSSLSMIEFVCSNCLICEWPLSGIKLKYQQEFPRLRKKINSFLSNVLPWSPSKHQKMFSGGSKGFDVFGGSKGDIGKNIVNSESFLVVLRKTLTSSEWRFHLR